MFTLFTPSFPSLPQFSHLLDQDALFIIKAIDKSGTQVRDTRSPAIHHQTLPWKLKTDLLIPCKNDLSTTYNCTWVSMITAHISSSQQKQWAITGCPVCVRHGARHLLQTWIRHGPSPSSSLQRGWGRKVSKQTDVPNFHYCRTSQEHRQHVAWASY